MKITAALHKVDRYLVSALGSESTWVTTAASAVGIAAAYFLAGEFGLALLAKPSGVAIFWPASGIAVGILVAAGRRAGVALVLGVVVGTVVANLTSDRNFLTSLLKGFCNAGETVLIAWLLDRWFGQSFTFSDLRRVVGFFAATAIATATSAVGGALTMITFHISAPFFNVWSTWFLSDAVGIVVIAPLLIEISQLRYKWSSQLFEGVGVLALTALVSIYAISFSASAWLSFDIDNVVFLLLLWLTARKQRMFAIAGALAVSLLVIGATIFGVGHYGNTSVPIQERALVAQLVATVVSAFALVLIVLFAEHKASEQGLRESEERLRLAQLKTGVGIWDLNLRTGTLTCTPELEAIYGLKPGSVTCYADFCARVHPEDIAIVEAQRHAAVCRQQERFAIEFRIVRPDGQVRWISAIGGAIYDQATGAPVRVLGNNTDITARKVAAQALAERNAQLALAERAARVGNFAYYTDREIMQISEGYASIHGFLERTTVVARSQCLATVHQRDLERKIAARSDAFRNQQSEYSVEYRIIRPDGEVRWVETRCFISYASEGSPHHIVGVCIDTTERKKNADVKNLLIAELDHRVKNVLICVAAVAHGTRETANSMNDFVSVLEDRISSLANTHSLLSHNRWQGVGIADLVRSELAPWMRDGNALIDGPDVVLSAEATQPVSMVLHELATNAAKYGPFSDGHGQVSVCWEAHSEGGAARDLVLKWRETGGPTVAAHNNPGYGTSVIRDLIPYELGGAVDYQVAADGARCSLQIPNRWLNFSAVQTTEHVVSARAHR